MSQPSKEISSGEANSGTQQKADVHVNPMDTQPHEDIIEDMLESPQWNDGLAGILTPGRPLLATLSRSDQGWWVAQDYNLNEQQAFDIFYAFLCMRELYHMQHPNLSPPPAPIYEPSAKARARQQKTLGAMTTVVAAGGKFKHSLGAAKLRLGRGYREFGDEKACLCRDDVARVAAFICEPAAVEGQTQAFMRTFDAGQTGQVHLRQFLEVLEGECSKRRLRISERIFFFLDEPTSSRGALYSAMAILVTIVVSSLGFILATEPTLQYSEDSLVADSQVLGASLANFLGLPSGGDGQDDDDTYRNAPKPRLFFFVLEAACILIFTVEYVARLLTIGFVRPELRPLDVQVPLLAAFLPEPEAGLDLDGDGVDDGVGGNNAASGGGGGGGPGNKKKNKAQDRRSETNLFNSSSMTAARASPLQLTWEYATTWLNLVDFVAIAPFFINLAVDSGGGGLAVLRVLRLARVFRVFRVGAINEGITMLGNTMSTSRPPLELLGFFMLIGVVLFGSLEYFAESGVWFKPYTCADATGTECPQGAYLRQDLYGDGWEFTPFGSIPRSFWYVVVSSTTVGYGDLFPTSNIGKAMGTLTMIVGILVLALPITIIGTNFVEEYMEVEGKKERLRRYQERELKRLNESGVGLEDLHKAETDGGDEAEKLEMAVLVRAPQQGSSNKKSAAPLAVGKEVSMGGDYASSSSANECKEPFDALVEEDLDSVRSITPDRDRGVAPPTLSPSAYARKMKMPSMAPTEAANSKEHLTPRGDDDGDEGKPQRVLDLVDRSLRETMGGAYGRMLHRAKRTERIKIATQRDKDRLQDQSQDLQAGTPHKKVSHFATLKASLSSSFSPLGAHGHDDATALPTLLHPRFLYNARASARTFCGVNLVEDFARYKHKPKSFNAAVSAFSSISSFDMSSLHGGLKPHKSPFKNVNGASQLSAGCLPSTCFEYPYILTDDELTPFNGVIDACQTLLDHLLSLHHDEKLTESALRNMAREAQCLLRRALVAAQNPTPFNAAAHAGHTAKASALAAAASGQKGSFDAGEHPMAISARNAQAAAAAAEAAMAKGGDTTEAQAYQMEMNGRSAGRHRHPRPGSAAGQAADNAVAAMLVWLRREALVEPSAGDDKSQALDPDDERLVRLHVLKLASEACKVPHTLA